MSAKQGSKLSTTTANHEEFRKLLEDISNAYRGKKQMLRLLLNDHCSGYLLSKPVDGMTGLDLFNDLKDQHYIFRDHTDVEILLDIGTVTDHASVVQLVKDFKEKYPNTDANYKSKYKDKQISTFRKNLFAAVKANSKPVKQMHASYDDELKGEMFDDIWDFVFKLEREEWLTEASKERFANLLDGKAKTILLEPASMPEDERRGQGGFNVVENGEPSEGAIFKINKKERKEKTLDRPTQSMEGNNVVINEAKIIKEQIDEKIKCVYRGKREFQKCVKGCETDIEEHKQSNIDHIGKNISEDLHVLNNIRREKNATFEKQEIHLQSKKTALENVISDSINDPEKTGNIELQNNIIKDTEEEIKRYSAESFLFDEEHHKPTITTIVQQCRILRLRIVDWDFIIDSKDSSFSVTKGQPFTVNVARQKSNPDTFLAPVSLDARLICPSGKEKPLDVVEDKKHGQFRITDKCNEEGNWIMEVMTAEKYYIKGSPVNITVVPIGLVNNTTTVFHKIPRGQHVTDVVLLDTEGSMLVSTNCEFFKFNNSGECVINTKCTKKIKRLHQMSDGYIVYIEKNSIVKCDDTLNKITTFNDNKLESPLGLIVSSETGVMYVADSTANCVFKFNMDDGSLIGTIGEEGSKDGQMYFPTDVALIGRDRIMVTDLGNHRVQMFDVNGTYLKTMAGKGVNNGQVEDPRGIVIDDDENIIVSSRHKIQLFDKHGVFLRRIDETKDAINLPSSITVISKKPRRLAVVNSGENNVKVYNY